MTLNASHSASFLNNSTLPISINELLKETEVSFTSSFTRKELNTSTPSVIMAFRALQMKAKEMERNNYELRNEKYELINTLKSNNRSIDELSRLSSLYSSNKDYKQEVDREDNETDEDSVHHFEDKSFASVASFLTSSNRNFFLAESKEVELNIDEVQRKLEKLDAGLNNEDNLNFTLNYRQKSLQKIYTDLENDIISLNSSKKKYESYCKDKLTKISELKQKIHGFSANSSFSLKIPENTSTFFPVYNSDLSLSLPSSPPLPSPYPHNLQSQLESLKSEEERLESNVNEMKKKIDGLNTLFKQKNSLIEFINKLNSLLLKFFEDHNRNVISNNKKDNEINDKRLNFLLNKSILLLNTIKNCHNFNDLIMTDKFYELFLASNALIVTSSSPIASFTLPTSSSMLKLKKKIETPSLSPSLTPTGEASVPIRRSTLSKSKSFPIPPPISISASVSSPSSHSIYPPAPPSTNTDFNSISVPASYYPSSSSSTKSKLNISTFSPPSSPFNGYSPYTSISSASPKPFITNSSQLSHPNLSSFTLDLTNPSDFKKKEVKKKKSKSTGDLINSNKKKSSKKISTKKPSNLSINSQSNNNSFSYTDMISSLPGALTKASQIIKNDKKLKKKIIKKNPKENLLNNSSLGNISSFVSTLNNNSNLSFSSTLSNLAENRSIFRNSSRVSLNDLTKAANEASRSLLYPIPSPLDVSTPEDYNIHNVEFIPSSITEGTEFNIIASMSKATRATKQLNAALQSKIRN